MHYFLKPSHNVLSELRKYMAVAKSLLVIKSIAGLISISFEIVGLIVVFLDQSSKVLETLKQC
jgi:hypothetical protein